APDFPDLTTVELVDGEERVKFKLLLMHIALYGTKLRAEAFKAAREERAPLVVCGHSHVPFLGRDRGVTVFNPGSIGPRRFHLPILFGAVDISPSGVRMRHFDCATGKAWEP